MRAITRIRETLGEDSQGFARIHKFLERIRKDL